MAKSGERAGRAPRTQKKVIQETARITGPVGEKPKDIVKIGMSRLGLKADDILSYKVTEDTVVFITKNARKLKYTLE